MRELVKNYLDTIVKTNTRKNYAVAIEQFVSYLEKTLNTDDKNIDIKTLKVSDIKKYRKHLIEAKVEEKNKYSKRSINQKLFAIESFFNYLLDDDVVEKNIVKGFEAYSVDKVANVFLNKDEANALLSYMESMKKKPDERKFELRKSRDTFMICLMLNTGLRISEVLAVGKDDIKSDGELFIPKTKNDSPHTVYLNKKSMGYYQKYLIERNKMKNISTDKLFISIRGKSMEASKSIVNRELKQYCKDANVKEISPHKLRHSATCC